MTIQAQDYISANNASFEHPLASCSFEELANERAIYTRIKGDIETLLNTLRNAPGQITSNQGSDLRDDLLNQASDIRGQIIAQLDLIGEAE